MLGEVGGHGLHHFGTDGRRGRMVKVDLPHGAPASASGMGTPGGARNRRRAPPSKSSNLLEFNISRLRRLSRTSYDCYHIHDDFPERRPGEDFDEDPLRHAFHDRSGPKSGGGPGGPEGYRRTARAFPRSISSRSSRPLASAGLLDVTRGNQGGYRLSRDASAITLADIVAASEDGLELLDCMGSLSACERAEDCPSRRVWGGLQAAIGDYLSGLTLADVASSAAAANL